MVDTLFSRLLLSVARDNACASPSVVNLRCPQCGKQGAFHGSANCADLTWNQHLTEEHKKKNIVTSLGAGVRVCPAPDCKAPVFVIRSGTTVLRSFPPEVLDFDSTALPVTIASTLEEAVKCHASECFRASALMVRRVLEEVCEDKSAEGKNLKERLANLGGAVLVPKELIEAADELRILGNDAAHIEAKTYDQIGRPEAEVAIDLAKEILKAVYQYSALVGRLKALKKPEPPATP